MTFRRYIIIWVAIWIIGVQIANHAQRPAHGLGTVMAVGGGLMTLASASYWWDTRRKGSVR